MNISVLIAFILLSYFMGSIPFGYLLTRYATGHDIMTMGSGNVGSTNVKRVAGKKIALITQLLDMFKGFFPVGVYLYFLEDLVVAPEWFVFALALSSIVGHDFSIFLRFKGGKGVNTTLGASLLLAPYSVFIAVAIYYAVKWRFKYVSLGSLMLGISLPLTEVLIHGVGMVFYYLLTSMLLIVVLHRTNIKRLMHHQELPS